MPKPMLESPKDDNAACQVLGVGYWMLGDAGWVVARPVYPSPAPGLRLGPGPSPADGCCMVDVGVG